LAAACAVVGAAVLVGVLAGRGAAAGSPVTFKMKPSSASVAAGCLSNAHADVTVTPEGAVEQMTVHAVHLPKNTDFDLFVIQVPNAPFGLSWYQGDLETNNNGVADGTFVGRFSIETFIVAPGTAPAPVIHDSDASTNPATAPVHTFHLGLWFNSPTDAAAAGCSAAVTPFNGEHNAGVQALSTLNFGDAHGPLLKVVS
jgi:hypothetical protein